MVCQEHRHEDRGLPVNILLKTVLRIKADGMNLLQVRAEIVRSRPVLGLRLTISMMAAVSDSILPVYTLQMSVKVIRGSETLCCLATTRLSTFMWLLMPGDMLSTSGRQYCGELTSDRRHTCDQTGF